MPKNPISDEELLKKDDYKSIMYLIENYQYQENKDTKKREEVGLTAGHLLYALRKKNGDFENDPEMEEFFTDYNVFSKKKTTLNDIASDKKYNYFVDKKKIIRGCIKNSVQLNERLKKLRDRGWIETKDEPRYYRYFTTIKWIADKKRRMIKKEVGRWKPDSIIDKFIFDVSIRKKFDFMKDKYIGSFVLCGIPGVILINLSEKERNELSNWIEKATEYLYKIMELKHKKMKLSEKEYMKLNFNERLNSSEIGFHYRAYKNPVPIPKNSKK